MSAERSRSNSNPGWNKTRILLNSILMVGLLGTSGCALFSKLGDLGPKYEPDRVDDFHAQAKALHSSLTRIGERIAGLRHRIARVVKGDVSFESIKGEVQNLEKMVGIVKRLPSRAINLLKTAKQMLVEAPKQYAGPQALHLPKKVELIKESITTLKEIPSACKNILMEGVALTKCVGGLSSGSTANCDARALVASKGNAVGAKKVPYKDWPGSSKPSRGRPGSSEPYQGLPGSREPSSRNPVVGRNPARRGPPGGLLVKSRPTGAQVFLDGQKASGTTPLTLRNLSSGKHLLELKKDFLRYRGDVRVMGGRYSTVTAALRKVRVNLEIISTPPEAQIYIGRRRKGKTPRILKGLPAGEHVINLRMAGYITVSRKIRLGVDDGMKTVSINLERAGFLTVRSVPAGAEVFLDGRRVGRSPVKLTASQGTHTVKLEMKDHGPVTRRVTFKAGSAAKTTFRLELTRAERQRRAEEKKKRAEEKKRRAEEKKKLAEEKKQRAEEKKKQRAEAAAAKLRGTLRVVTSPAGAMVAIGGGDYVGKAPVSIELKCGRHTVSVSLTGYRTLERQVRVVRRRTRTEKFDLEQVFGQVILAADPPDAAGSLNWEKVELGKPVTLPVGSHNVSYARPGWKKLSGAVSITEGAVVTARGILARTRPPVPTIPKGRIHKVLFPPPTLILPWKVGKRRTGTSTWVGIGLITAGAGLTTAGAFLDTDYTRGITFAAGLTAGGLGLGYVLTPLFSPHEHAITDSRARQQNDVTIARWKAANQRVAAYNAETMRILRKKAAERQKVIQFNRGRDRIKIITASPEPDARHSRRPPGNVPAMSDSSLSSDAIKTLPGPSLKRMPISLTEQDLSPSGALVALDGTIADGVVAGATKVKKLKQGKQAVRTRRLTPGDAARNRRRGTLFATGIGLFASAAACLTAGVVYTVSSRDTYAAADRARERYLQGTTDSEVIAARQDANHMYQDAHNQSVTGVVLLGGAAASAVAGALMLLLSPDRIEQSTNRPGVSIGIGPVRGGVTTALSWSF